MDQENNQGMGNTGAGMDSQPSSSGSKKGIVWLIVLVIIALIIVAFATGKKSETEELLIDENASDEISEIEADLDGTVDLDQLDQELESVENL